MAKNPSKYYPLEPRVRFSDYRPHISVAWEAIDRAATKVLGTECVGIPSVRVGMSWTLEHLSCARHRDHVLVPRFMGRCILNSLNRNAMPVESITPETRLVIAVHQFGLKQNLELIEKECSIRQISYIEDSPFGVESDERLGPGSLGKFIGLSKVLPVLKGALVISHDQSLVEFIKGKRSEHSFWSWPIWGAMALLRHRQHMGAYSALADAAYEMYLQCKGDNSLLRANFLHALEKFDSFAAETKLRLSLIKSRLSQHVLVPDTDRLSYVVPYLPGNDLNDAQEVFTANGFDPSLMHVDQARNLFRPSYDECLLIPLNPRIPAERFEKLVESLSTLGATQASKSSPNAASVIPR